jgi:outer membrane murein-binding lipoprotein Lpp
MTLRTGWGSLVSLVLIAGIAALLGFQGTIPAARARVNAAAKNARLLAKRDALETEIAQLRAEHQALKTDDQYNRRLERLYFRGGPEPGD